ncbi:MetQ/NlpA family ABC transporter substrate-binding protein [Caldimonas brevitalea]|uniref:Methionine ABC transporter substrate-binding protein n=1 Tax=Caldimonas brevitalea TaxID=413882 RepID=A0A0G3BGH5_9BURK|nr:MetQ/NlpA family ABC transporter substrate-binding protein [Caldimonas brevitalea]AKJ28534.1 methionine ABC transporter substrate-binding protein [Caldimonas brevitalea]
MSKQLLTWLAAGLLGLGGAHADTLSVAASPVPHAEILEFIKPRLAQEGVELQIKVFDDYIQPNVQVAEKRLDANFFQHKPYLDEYNKSKGTKLVLLTPVHIEPFGAYSRKYKSAAELPEGATIAVPNNPANTGRALLLLAGQGLITLKDPGNILATERDIVSNPKKLKIRQLDAAALPRVLDQVDAAIINTNYALQAKLVPTRDAIFFERGKSYYANALVARPDNQDREAIKKLSAALNSPDVRRFLEEKYQGAVVPAF